MNSQSDPRLEALSTLLHIEQEARKAESQEELSFILVNDTRRLLSCDQAWFWVFDELARPRIERGSNVSEVDGNSIQVRWLVRLLDWCQQQSWHNDVRVMSLDEIPDELQKDSADHLPPHVLYVPLVGRTTPGGLLLASREPWVEGHAALAEILSGTYAHAWNALRRPQVKRQLINHFKRYWVRYTLLITIFLLYPARQYVLAPAEVVPADPFVVAAPLSGVIEAMSVEPNDLVEEGATLFSFEDTELENRLIIAQRAFEVAEAEFFKNAQASFDCDECRAEAAQLQAVMLREQAQVAMAREQFERSLVKAPRSGVAVFSDVGDWVGRPVRVGEKVMSIADPDATRLRIELPVEDAIAIDLGSAVVFYPNISPLDSFDGEITQTSYEAQVTPEQVLAYPLLASFEGDQMARLGLRGTAKIYGGRAPLLYLILRKPLSWVRRSLGL